MRFCIFIFDFIIMGCYIRIYNKISSAFDFMIDMACIVDYDKKNEFVLGTVIYVNENEILNDGVYDYERNGYPFLRDSAQLFYEYKVNMPRTYVPGLSKYNWKLWVED